MDDDFDSAERSWWGKFSNAFRGLKVGIRGQSSFFVHFFTTIVVLVSAAVLQVSLAEWCILIMCITIVLTAEMFNSSLESMAKAITGESHPHLGNSLDIASAAVLVASVGASVIGAIIFLNRIGLCFEWW